MHDRMVGIGKRAGNDLPGFVPGHAFIQQDAHQFGNRQRRMRVIDMNDILLGKIRQVVAILLELPDDGLDAGGNKEVLLLQPQDLALFMRIFRIQHLGDHLDQIVLGQGPRVLAPIEQAHVQMLGGTRAPKPQRVDQRRVVSDNRHVIGNRFYRLVRFMAESRRAIIVTPAHLTLKPYVFGFFRFFHFPDMTVFQP